MAEKGEQLLDSIARMVATVEDWVERNKSGYLKRVRQIVADPEERHDELWEQLGAPLEWTVEEHFLGLTAEERSDPLWLADAGAFFAAAKEQPYIEMISSLISEAVPPLMDAQDEAIKASQDEMKEAGERGVSKSRVGKQLEKKRAERNG